MTLVFQKLLHLAKNVHINGGNIGSNEFLALCLQIIPVIGSFKFPPPPKENIALHISANTSPLLERIANCDKGLWVEYYNLQVFK